MKRLQPISRAPRLSTIGQDDLSVLQQILALLTKGKFLTPQ